MFFWNSLAVSMIQWILAIWYLVPLPFLNSACASRRTWFTNWWSLAWRILNMILLICEISAIVWLCSLALPFFGVGMKMDLFKSCGHCWVFQIFILSAALSQHHLLGSEIAQLALFIVILLKAHLTSHSRMSGSRWVITPLWLSEYD